ncbi:hypothetical protein L1276_004208 [Flavobacterium sp. HSC-32F16]|uniref:DUF2931 family protein n=1 Tax=Flavobacterium sp. HSC-32F16 TaxID=2910964 RepID=UPI0020A36843|nr:DUF2931 family protein [Flavobacterium sp. HSC-32F16]MCP2029029.1 hypothetical protein [Flavobacterium sp. HSC-32F16]
MKINNLNKIYILIVITLLVILLKDVYNVCKESGMLIFNKEEKKEMLIKTEKFGWLAAAGAGEEYPMEIVSGSFIASDGSAQWIPSREVLKAGWGNSNGSWVVGDELRKVPERMILTWLSYAENKFFTGEFELPQQKMYELFKQNYGKGIHPDGSEFDLKFSELTVGLAPKGLVTLWISGFAQIEIGTYQAHETNIEWENFYRGEAKREVVIKSYQNDMLPFVQDEITHNKINNIYWKDLLERYKYSINFNKTEQYKIYDYEIWFINHESVDTKSNDLNYILKSQILKAIPGNMVLFLKDNFGRKLEVRIDLCVPKEKKIEENLSLVEERNKNLELIKVFKTFYAQNENVELYIKFNKEIVKSNIYKPVYSGKVFLKSSTSEVEIPNSTVAVYDAD